MMERLGSNNKQQTTNNKQQTTNNKQQTTSTTEMYKNPSKEYPHNTFWPCMCISDSV
jgi:hypothetical protein